MAKFPDSQIDQTASWTTWTRQMLVLELGIVPKRSNTKKKTHTNTKHIQQVVLINLFLSFFLFMAAQVSAAGVVEPQLALEIDLLIHLAIKIRRWRERSFV